MSASGAAMKIHQSARPPFNAYSSTSLLMASRCMTRWRPLEGIWSRWLWKNPVTPDTNQNAVRRLLTIEEADAPSGAVAVYVCPECGDPGCGAITVRISATKEEFIWEDFGYENDYDGERTLLPVIGPFRFARAQYEAALKPFAQS